VNPIVADGGGLVGEVPSKTNEIVRSDVIEKVGLESKAGETPRTGEGRRGAESKRAFEFPIAVPDFEKPLD
jgi:hypothetical protein